MTKQEFYDLDLPAVTTILSATMSRKKKEGLAAWRDRVGKAKAQEIVNASRERGKRLDAAFETMLDTGDVIFPALAASLEPYKIHSGHTCLANGLYKGERDCRLNFHGWDICVDFKTSVRKKRQEHFEDEALQLAALNFLDPCDSGLILNYVFDPEGEHILYTQAFSYGGAELARLFEEFYERLEIFMARN